MPATMHTVKNGQVEVDTPHGVKSYGSTPANNALAKRLGAAVVVFCLMSSPAWAQLSPSTAMLQNVATATGNGTTIVTDGYSTVGLTVTISNTATVTFEATQDVNTWQAVVCTQTSNTSATLVTTATATGTYHCAVSGMVQFRARISAYTSGTVTVTATASPGVLGKGGGGGGGSNSSVGTVGAAAPTSATQICGTDGTNCVVPQVLTTAPAANAPALAVRNINTALAADNSANSTSKAPVLPCRANAATQTWTEGNQVPCSTDLNGNIRVLLNQVPSAATVSADAQAPPLTSSLYNYNMCFNGSTWDRCRASGAVDAANNAAPPTNVEVIGAEATTAGSQASSATATNVARPVMSTNRVLYVQQGGPVTFTCSATGIAASLTQLTGCGAPGAGLSYYITSIIAQSNTSTAGNFLLRYGTNANCGTGTTSIYPGAATTAVGFLPANTAQPLVLTFPTPIKVAANNLVCALGVATNTTLIDVAGFIAP